VAAGTTLPDIDQLSGVTGQMPGEQKEIKIEFKKVDLGNDQAILKVEPYNNTHFSP
jgi:hypothetical protein